MLTVMACTYAIESFVPLFVILKGNNNLQFCEGFPNRVNVIVIESGWINDRTYLKWLRLFNNSAHHAKKTGIRIDFKL